MRMKRFCTKDQSLICTLCASAYVSGKPQCHESCFQVTVILDSDFFCSAQCPCIVWIFLHLSNVMGHKEKPIQFFCLAERQKLLMKLCPLLHPAGMQVICKVSLWDILVQENKLVSNAFNGLLCLWSDAEYESVIQGTLKMECNILTCYMKNLLYHVEQLTKQNERHLAFICSILTRKYIFLTWHLFLNHSFYISLSPIA